jgi:hypothetical protein
MNAPHRRDRRQRRGILAAIAAARRHAVVIARRRPAWTRRSGHGKRPLQPPERRSDETFTKSTRSLVRSVFDRFGGTEISAFFRTSGWR